MRVHACGDVNDGISRAVAGNNQPRVCFDTSNGSKSAQQVIRIGQTNGRRGAGRAGGIKEI